MSERTVEVYGVLRCDGKQVVVGLPEPMCREILKLAQVRQLGANPEMVAAHQALQEARARTFEHVRFLDEQEHTLISGVDPFRAAPIPEGAALDHPVTAAS